MSLFSTRGRGEDPAPAPFGFALKIACLLADARGMWICRFPRVLPADITIASLFVLVNHAPALKLPSNYCSQLLGIQESSLITEREVAAGCAAWSWKHHFNPAGIQEQPLLWDKKQRFPVSVVD